nr:hypothetical protein [Tanacetum cinerariifolium]
MGFVSRRSYVSLFIYVGYGNFNAYFTDSGAEFRGFLISSLVLNLKLINVCFADDLFLFARGDMELAKLIMDALDEFKSISGLVPIIPKSKAYFCNVLIHVKLSILNAMPFVEGKILVKYLGVPLISSRLMNRDCRILVERVKSRVGDWKNNLLSFTDIEQAMPGFLWCQGEMKRGKAKVTWKIVCFPKQEGGLDQTVWKDLHGIKKSFSVYVVETSFGLGDATLPVAPAPLSPNYVPTSSDYTLNYDSDSRPFKEDPQEADPEESSKKEPSKDDSPNEDTMEADEPLQA